MHALTTCDQATATYAKSYKDTVMASNGAHAVTHHWRLLCRRGGQWPGVGTMPLLTGLRGVEGRWGGAR